MTIHSESPTTNEIYIHGPGDGRHLHVLDNLGTVKTTAAGNHSMAVVEFTAPRDFGPPVHLHEDEDEFLYLLDGELEVFLGEQGQAVSAGSFVWLPRGVPHTFQVMTETARMLSVTSGTTGPPPSFDAMMIDLGTDVDTPTIPNSMDIDPGQVAAVCARYGVNVVGPPPAPRL